ncbi:MAG TPA: zinc-ribbon domain-containing protein [Candidatus Lokiarchaeia archaeon]|nr:zinc-ribbon domain-containing protein [Candidatus Lokiarchaeia archaeon]
MSNCPYCNKPVKDNDRFCLYCGEPLLKMQQDEAKGLDSGAGTGSNKKGSPAATRSASQPTGSKRAFFSDTSSEPDETAPKVVETKAPAEEAEEKTLPASESALDPAIKEQIEARMEIYQLDKKIKKLKDRIADSLKLMDDPEFKKKYDNDDDFHKANEVRFTALKQLGEELKAQKKELEKTITKDFILELSNMKIKRLKGQIEELNNSFKLKKVDKKSYNTLHSEYMIQLTESIKQRDIHNIQLGMWSSSLRAEFEDLKHQANVLKARKNAREISKDQLKEEKENIVKKLAVIEANIKIVESFIFKD